MFAKCIAAVDGATDYANVTFPAARLTPTGNTTRGAPPPRGTMLWMPKGRALG